MEAEQRTGRGWEARGEAVVLGGEVWTRCLSSGPAYLGRVKNLACKSFCKQTGHQAKPQIHARKEKAVTNVDKRQKDSDGAWQMSVEKRGAGLRLGLFPEIGILYKLNLRRVFTAMGRFDVTV